MSTQVADILLTAGANDDGNAECAVAIFGQNYLHTDAYGWLRWTGTHWDSRLAEKTLDNDITTMLRMRSKFAVDKGNQDIARCSWPSAKHISDTKKLFDERVGAHVDEFDKDPDLLNVKNGVLNLRTGTLTPHDSTQRFTYCVTTEYDPTADSTVWENFLWDSLSNHIGTEDSRKRTAELVDYVQMVLGYAITGHTNEESAWFIHGPARAGKGTFTETILKLIGYPLAVEVDFSTFTAKRAPGDQGFDLAPLKPARIVFASESNVQEWLNTGKVKRITGGNYITCSFKHRDQFTYRPQFKLILTSNHPARADADDDAMWYRMKVLHFPNGHMHTEDKSLKEKMQRPDVLRGVLRWMVDGAMKWFASPNGLKDPADVNAATTQARDEVDFVQAWLNECTEKDEKHWTPNSSVYTSYKVWCDEQGVMKKSQRGLALSLQKKGYKTGVIDKVGLKKARGVEGLRIL